MNNQLLDHLGRPVQRRALRREIAGPTEGGGRSPLSTSTTNGMTPDRLAAILRAAEQGDPLRYLELAEIIEERDLHYAGVMGTRKRSVSQIDISVDAASDDPHDVAIADMIRDWLRRDELQLEIFDILDAIGKGYSFTEIIWEYSEGQYWPARLEWRDPRWFRFDRRDLTTPKMLDDHGQEMGLPAFKFISATMKAKSGLPLRGGLTRIAAFAWMFKAYTQRDWALFVQNFGQPIRLGKYDPSGATSPDDMAVLRSAVRNVAGDCAAIIPSSMEIEFIDPTQVGSKIDLFKERVTWLDHQISKAVLGQTATTDAVTGGLGSGKEHRQVQEDIERADATALTAILNRDLIRPFVDLNNGPQKRYPKLRLVRPEVEDIEKTANALAALVPIGLTVETSEVRDRMGFSDPGEGAEVLRAPENPANAPDIAAQMSGRESAKDPAAILKRLNAVFKGGAGDLGAEIALQQEQPSQGGSGALLERPFPASDLAERLVGESADAMAGILGQIEAMMEAAGSLEELREMLSAGLPGLDAEALQAALADALTASHASGRIAIAKDEAEADA